MMDRQHQLETLLSGEICTLYQRLTGHTIILSDCRFLNDEQLALVFEESITPVEQLLRNAGLSRLTQTIRFHVDQIFHHRLSELVQRITQRSVVDILAESRLNTQRKGIILILGPSQSSKN